MVKRGMTTLALAIAVSALLLAQTRPEVDLAASPRGLAAAQVAGAWADTGDGPQYQNGLWITIDYGRPILRGRQQIFGAGADYGTAVNGGAELWRAGANETTRLTTQAPLRFGTTTVQPGVYNVLVDLEPDVWTFVLSTQPIQPAFDPNDRVRLYGATNYDPAFDAVRVPMRVSRSPVSVEQFTISFVDVTADRGSIAMAWEHTVGTVDFEVR